MLNAKGVSEGEFLEYKGRPLVRKDNDIYYGDLAEKYHVFILIFLIRGLKFDIIWEDYLVEYF